jgi:hypothetical protein
MTDLRTADPHILGTCDQPAAPATPCPGARADGQTLAHGLHGWRLRDVPHFFQCADDIQLPPF